MSKGKANSVAPKERINVTYIPKTDDQQAEKELPFNAFVIGDMKGAREDTILEKRQPVSVDKNNFNSVMEKAGIKLSVCVPDRLSDNPQGNELPVNLEIKSLADFSPDNIARAIPEMKKILELREALVALKGPLGNIPAFRTTLQRLLSDEKARQQLMEELELVDRK